MVSKEEAQIDAVAGEWLRRKRLALGISQDQIAAAAGTTHQQIAKYEAGTSRWPMGRFVAFAEALKEDPTAALEEILAACKSGYIDAVPDRQRMDFMRMIDSLSPQQVSIAMEFVKRIRQILRKK